jgi:chromosome partitioning protein
MRRVIFNQKGGVGKTTIVCNLAAAGASRGRKTLVLDLDSQCNASQYLLSSAGLQAESGSADFFESTLSFRVKGADLNDYVTETPFDNLSVMAAHPDLDVLQVKLESRQKVGKLRQALDKLKTFDDIYIDTPPAMNFYSRSALIAADRCLIPFDCDDFARQALYALFDNIAEIQADHNEDLQVEGIVVNQFQARARLPRQLVNELLAEGHSLVEARLSSSVKVKESHERSIPLVYLAPRHKVTQQMQALFDELNSPA